MCCHPYAAVQMWPVWRDSGRINGWRRYTSHPMLPCYRPKSDPLTAKKNCYWREERNILSKNYCKNLRLSGNRSRDLCLLTDATNAHTSCFLNALIWLSGKLGLRTGLRAHLFALDQAASFIKTHGIYKFLMRTNSSFASEMAPYVPHFLWLHPVPNEKISERRLYHDDYYWKMSELQAFRLYMKWPLNK